jgi:hypothetical protein
MRRAIPAQRLVELIKGGCEAKIPLYSANGKQIKFRADWKTRKPYIEMASKHAGYYEDKSAQAGNQIVISVTHVGANSRQQRVIEANDNADD